MHGFGPNSNDRVPREEPATPWGYDPEGRPVFVVEQLPAMPILEKIVIGADHLELNGWTFLYSRTGWRTGSKVRKTFEKFDGFSRRSGIVFRLA